MNAKERYDKKMPTLSFRIEKVIADKIKSTAKLRKQKTQNFLKDVVVEYLEKNEILKKRYE